MRKLVKWILYFLTLVFVLLLSGAYLSSYISPADIWQLSFFGLVFPVILIFSKKRRSGDRLGAQSRRVFPPYRDQNGRKTL